MLEAEGLEWAGGEAEGGFAGVLAGDGGDGHGPGVDEFCGIGGVVEGEGVLDGLVLVEVVEDGGGRGFQIDALSGRGRVRCVEVVGGGGAFEAVDGGVFEELAEEGDAGGAGAAEDAAVGPPDFLRAVLVEAEGWVEVGFAVCDVAAGDDA